MTDNRANEQIVLKVLHPEATRNLPMAEGYAEEAVEALRAAGRLVGEPSEAQVKLAYLAHLKAPRARGMDVYGPMRAALVAAARVPVQGEPNDDREAMLRRIESFDYDSDRVSDDLEQDIRALVAISRATVPDAATEAGSRAPRRLREMRAERDAALAAIERVRALETFSITDSYPAWTAVDHDELLAALDGAPEPEVSELPETGLEVRDGDGDLIMSGEHRKVLHQGMYVCDSCVNDLGLNVRWDRAGFMEGHPLPVEGGSK